MPCGCQGKSGEKASVTRPYDQCTACARKHVKNAWSKWGEFCYEDANRDYVSAQLRDAADHLKYDHPETAMQCRALAMAIEENREEGKAQTAATLERLLDEVRGLFYADNPEAKERLEAMRNGD